MKQNYTLPVRERISTHPSTVLLNTPSDCLDREIRSARTTRKMKTLGKIISTGPEQIRKAVKNRISNVSSTNCLQCKTVHCDALGYLSNKEPIGEKMEGFCFSCCVARRIYFKDGGLAGCEARFATRRPSALRKTSQIKLMSIQPTATCKFSWKGIPSSTFLLYFAPNLASNLSIHEQNFDNVVICFSTFGHLRDPA